MTQSATPLLVEEKVPLKSRIWISAADSAAAILQTVIGGGALTYYFLRVMGLTWDWISLGWLLFGIWNAVNDPLFGYISDRTKSKIGRRKPYIRYGAPFFVLSFIAFWIPITTTQLGMFLQFTIALFLYDILYTAIATSIYIMPYEMAVSNKARSSIFIWKILFMIFPNILPFIIAFIQPGPGDDPTGFRTILIAMAVVMGIIIAVSTFFYEEKHFQQEEQQPPFLTAFKESLKNKAFIIFLVVSFTVIYIQTSLMQGVAYYFDEVMRDNGLPIYIGLAVGIVAGIFLWVKMRDRWGVKRCLMVWLGIFAAGCLILLSLGAVLPAAVLGFLFVGVGFSGGMYLIPIMNGDVIDNDEDRTGLRREGMYAGINSFVTKPAISLAQSAFLWILSMFGYQADLAKGAQPALAQTGILVAWTAIPAALLLISLLAMNWYPLAGPAWDKVKAALGKIHQEKEKKYLEAHGIKYVE